MNDLNALSSSKDLNNGIDIASAQPLFNNDNNIDNGDNQENTDYIGNKDNKNNIEYLDNKDNNGNDGYLEDAENKDNSEIKKKEKNKTKIAFSEESIPLRIFMVIMDILVFVDLILIPLEYFVLYYKNIPFLRLIIFDLFFLLECILKFFTAYYDQESKVYIYDIGKIAKNYLKGKFFFEILYTFPMYLIYEKLAIMRIIKIYRYHYIIGKFKKTLIDAAFRLFKNYAAISQVLNVFTFFITLCVILHFWVCIYCFLGLYIYEKSWINQHPEYMESDNKLDIYISSYYFITETFTSTGFGDLTPVNDFEYFYIILCQIITCGIYAYLLSNILSILTSKTKKLDFSSKHNLTNFQRWVFLFMNKLPASSKGNNIHRNSVWKKSKQIYDIYYNPSYNFEWLNEKDFLIQMKPKDRNKLVGDALQQLFEKFNLFFSQISKISSKISIVSNFKTVVEMNQEKLNKSNKIFFLEKGTIQAKFKGKKVEIFEEGQIIGLENFIDPNIGKNVEYIVENYEEEYAILFSLDVDILIKDILNYDGLSMLNISILAKSYIIDKLKIQKIGEKEISKMNINNPNLGDLYELKEEVDEINKGYDILKSNNEKLNLIKEQCDFMKKYIVNIDNNN